MKKLISLCAFFLLCGCIGFTESPPSQFYMLKTVPADPISQARLNIGIQEVQIPEYIKRPQIVTIENTVEYNISEFNRWSSSLSGIIRRTLASDMAYLLPKSFIKPSSIISDNYNHTISLEINRLDGEFDKNATLEAWWYILNRNGQIIYRGQTSLSRPTGDNYEEFVSAQSLLLAEMARQIAAKIITLH